MRFRNVAAFSSAAVLLGLTGCVAMEEPEDAVDEPSPEAEEPAATFPDEPLDEDELESLIPPEDVFYTDVEMADDSPVHSLRATSPEEWEEEIAEAIEYAEDDIEEFEDASGDEPGAEECLAAMEDYLEGLEETEQEFSEDPPQHDDVAFEADYSDFSSDGDIEFGVMVYTEQRLFISADVWLESNLACGTLSRGPGSIAADDIEEISLGDAIGYQADWDSDVDLVLTQNFGATQADFWALFDEDDADPEEYLGLAEEFFDHIEEELYALAESEQ